MSGTTAKTIEGTTMPSETENKLEKLLARDFDKPALRPAFYRVLLASTVYVISRTGLEGSGELYLKPGDSLSILSVPATGNIVVIPFFSSLDRLTYFAQEDADKLPHLVLGIDADADVPSIIRQAAAIAADTSPGRYALLVAVDMKRNRDDAVADLLRYGIFFYERRWGVRLSTTTTAGRA
jgi:hypothetical protein